MITNKMQVKEQIGKEILIRGRIYKIRKMRDFSFLLLQLPKGLLQCTLQGSPKELKEQACVEISAYVEAEPRSKDGFELKIRSYSLLSTSSLELPVVINGKQMDVSLDTLLSMRPITLRNEKERAIFRIQAGISKAFREFLEQEDFTEIHTPKIVSEGAEGGSNIFHLDYLGKEAYLTQSPQFYKQMMAGVYGRVYEIAPVFRAEHHDTARHLNEYTGLDFEMAYIDSFADIMEMETRFLQFLFSYLESNYKEELLLLSVVLPSVPTLSSIPVLTFKEAKEKIAFSYGREITDWTDFEPEEEKLLSEQIKAQTGSDFVYVTHYPSSKRPFYAMEEKDNPEVTLSFDLIFRGMEITTGGQRIHDYEKQIQKMKARGMNPENFASYLSIHRYGMPPHGGLGIGLERLTACLLGFQNIRLTSLFPRDINRITP